MKIDARAIHASRLAIAFEGYAAAKRGLTGGGMDTEHIHTIGTADGPGGELVEHELTTQMLEDAAVLLRERSNGLTLGVELARELRNAVGALPYGGLVMHLMPRHDDSDDQTIRKTVASLRALAVELTKVSEQHERERHELAQMKRQREALRELLGIPDLLDDLLGSVRALHEKPGR